MICLQQFYNNFITNPKWQVVTSYYYWVKKVINAKFKFEPIITNHP